MTDLQTLITQREELDGKIAELQQQKHAEAVAQVRSLIAAFGLTQRDLFGGSQASTTAKIAKPKVAAKYRDSATGLEWSGRGLPPRWLQGKNKADYLIPN